MLTALKTCFELVLFTSSSKIYCEAVINTMIENEEKYFEYKLYKKHCTVVSTYDTRTRVCYKNLDILMKGRNLKDLLIVDNRSENYLKHLRNGIPISDFKGDDSDRALFHL